MKQYETIFFDWDGVITDSVNIKTDSFCEIFKAYGKQVQEQVKNHHQQNGGMNRFDKFRLYYKEFLHIEIDENKVQELANTFSYITKKKVMAAQYINGALTLIQEEYAKGTKLFVVTGTPTDEIIEIAKSKDVYKYFLEFCGSPTDKSSWLAYLINKYNLNIHSCLFIGDAMADYNAAKDHNVDFLGIKIPSCQTAFPKGTLIKNEVKL